MCVATEHNFCLYNYTDSTELTVAVTLIRNDTGLSLSSSNLEYVDMDTHYGYTYIHYMFDRTAVLASSIFSLQMNPPPTSNALEKNPIAMTFDVVSIVV